MTTAPLNIWIYYTDHLGSLKKVQGGVFIDHWASVDVKAQLNAFVRDGILDKQGDWIPGNRIVRVELIKDVIDTYATKMDEGLSESDIRDRDLRW
jgi:hypothetical protein